MPPTKIPRLIAAQVEEFRGEGFLIVCDPILPQARFDALKAYFEELLNRLPANVRPESMDVPHFDHPRLFEWLFAEEVLDLVEPILGSDIALFSSHFICKPKGDGRRVPWHEDSAYWRDIISPMQVVTVWLAIDPSTKENGCMYVIPRTHHHGYSEYEAVDPSKHLFGSEIKASQRDESRAVACELQPNQASLHDGRLMHGSPPNTSRLRRCGYTMRYMPSSVKFNEAKFRGHQVYLARGRDLAGNVYADPARAYEEKARYRETSSPKGH